MSPPGEQPPRVVVVGAGIAGLAAAAGLAERGVAVDVVEQRDHLGGRVGGWPDTLADGSPAAMNRGFHAFFRQYYNLRALLRRAIRHLSALTPVRGLSVDRRRPDAATPSAVCRPPRR